MSKQDQQRKQEAEDNYEKSLHARNLQANTQPANEDGTAEILRYMSEIEDLPIGKEDPVMGQLISRLVSTANLSPEQVRSNEWVFQYLLVLYLSKFPRPDGMHSTLRAWSHNDMEEYRKPMKAERRMEIEAHVTMSGLALSRSEDMAAPREAMRTVNESIVNNDKQSSSGGNGLLGRMGLR